MITIKFDNKSINVLNCFEDGVNDKVILTIIIDAKLYSYDDVKKLSTCTGKISCYEDDSLVMEYIGYDLGPDYMTLTEGEGKYVVRLTRASSTSIKYDKLAEKLEDVEREGADNLLALVDAMLQLNADLDQLGKED